MAKHEERACAAIVCDVLGARWRRIEDSHDFDIVFPDGRVDYLEVSAFTNERIEGRWRQTPDPRRSSLASTWTLHVTGWADLRTVQQEAEPHLTTLESHDLSQYFAGDHYTLLARLEPDLDHDFEPTHPVAIASAALLKIGVEDATSLTGQGESVIELARSVSTIGTPTELINSAVRSVADKLDNIAKLTSTVARTHLFIPIRMPGGGVRSAVHQGPPPEAPQINSAIGRVWLLGRGEQVLFLDQGGSWQGAPFNPRVFSNPEAWSQA